MLITIENTGIDDFYKMLKEQYQLTPEKRFTITFDVKAVIDPEEDVSVGDDLIEGFMEIVEAQKKGFELPNARDLLNEL
ncbi:hypothetical protein MTBBW1_1630009 [Desulfamplus magnetovallimortis]|uniref:Uncharacterized protein n=1 Tax=Desulfamplus magnetovallimortis TaxID=1246637 RepID=A0A1W1H8X2_9BACT|nr:hypothetical protein [Desulfamplus magnetovallimortis]SLM28899.1 hypothetical protein MTBBW1_1630009 [Desulfamplus magnetovallimortis]